MSLVLRCVWRCLCGVFSSWFSALVLGFFAVVGSHAHDDAYTEREMTNKTSTTEQHRPSPRGRRTAAGKKGRARQGATTTGRTSHSSGPNQQATLCASITQRERTTPSSAKQTLGKQRDAHRTRERHGAQRAETASTRDTVPGGHTDAVGGRPHPPGDPRQQPARKRAPTATQTLSDR